MFFQKFLNNTPFEIFNFGLTEVGKKIGEGGNCNVYQATYNGKKYAIKIYNSFSRRNLNTFYKDLSYELNISNQLRRSSQSIHVHGIGYKKEPNNTQIIIYMDLLVSNGDLNDYIQNVAKWTASYKINGSLKPSPDIDDYLYYNKGENRYWIYTLSKVQKKKIIKSLAKAINELHSYGIIHGDIKTSNLVLHNNIKKQKIILIDFGMSYMNKDSNKDSMEYISGTIGYRAPEQEERRLSYASDIYSIGVTMIEVWTGEIWYDGEDFDSCRNEVLISLEKIIKKENELGKLLKRVIHLEEEKRPTATELMNELNKIRFY